jgi:hypothetical protein
VKTAGELSRSKLDPVGIQEVGWNKGGMEPAVTHLSMSVGI